MRLLAVAVALTIGNYGYQLLVKKYDWGEAFTRSWFQGMALAIAAIAGAR